MLVLLMLILSDPTNIPVLTFVSKEVAMAKDNVINGVGWVPPHLAGLSSIQVAPFCQIFRAFAGGVIPSHQVYVSEGLL